MENVEELVYEGFNEIIVDEFDDKFMVKILDLNGGVVSFHIDKNGESGKLWDIIKNYIENFKLSGIINYFPLRQGDNKYAEIRSQEGNNKISLKVYDRRYKVVFQNAVNKYIDDRSNFFGDTDISYLKLGNSNSGALYEKYDDHVLLCLKSDNRGEILDSEKEFLRDLLLYRFSLMQSKATMMVISDKNKLTSSYIIYCGDMVVTCPKNKSYSFIGDIINEHNQSLNENRKR